MALSIVVPIVANGIRAFGIIAIAYASDNELAVGVDHILYGWVFFSLVTALVLGIGMLLREPLDESNANAQRASPARRAHPASTRNAVAVAVLTLGLVAAGRMAAAGFDRQSSEAQLPPIAAPVLPTTWPMTPALPELSPPQFAHADRDIHTAYTKDGMVVHVYIGYYAQQRRGAEAVSSNHVLADERVWTTRQNTSEMMDVAGTPLSVNYLKLTTGRLERDLWCLYWVNGQYVGSPYLAKVLQAKAKLLGGERDAAIIAVFIDREAGKQAAVEPAIKEFLRHLGPMRAEPPKPS